MPPPHGAKPYKTTFFKAEQFVEKPYYDKAVEYLNSGQYRWNAGMFIWSFVTVTEGLQKHQPEMYEACQRWFKVANQAPKLNKLLAKDYPEFEMVHPSTKLGMLREQSGETSINGVRRWLRNR